MHVMFRSCIRINANALWLTPTPRKKLMQPRFKNEVAAKCALKIQTLSNDSNKDHESSEHDSDKEFWLLVKNKMSLISWIVEKI